MGVDLQAVAAELMTPYSAQTIAGIHKRLDCTRYPRHLLAMNPNPNIANLFYQIACHRYRMAIYGVILLQHMSYRIEVFHA